MTRHRPQRPTSGRLIPTNFEIGLWDGVDVDRVTTILAMPPGWRWASRAELDEGTLFPIIALITFDGVFTTGVVVRMPDGSPELVLAKLDGYDVDVRRVITAQSRRAVGEAVVKAMRMNPAPGRPPKYLNGGER